MEIRKATLADAHTLSALNVDVQKIHADAHPHIFKQPAGDSFALHYMLERLEDPSSLFLIANHDGQDIGYLFAHIVDRPDNLYMHPWKYLHIDQISVKPSYQGLGCGRLLLQTLRQIANQLEIETILLLFGLACYLGSPTLLLLTLLSTPLIHLFVRYIEEPRTEHRLGEPYRQYKRSVPRWLPKIHP